MHGGPVILDINLGCTVETICMKRKNTKRTGNSDDSAEKSKKSGMDLKIVPDILRELGNYTMSEPFTFKVIRREIKKRSHRYQYFNQLAVCTLRIDETIDYINTKRLIKQNESGEAFDFYELINSISIILGCTEILFKIFGVEFPTRDFSKKTVFKIGNQIRLNDVQFFKFIRSAASVHPSNTNSFVGKTKRINEFFPYAIWKFKSPFNEKLFPPDCDLVLVSWSGRTHSKDNFYYLCSDEFYEFAQKVVDKIELLIPKAAAIRDEYIKKRSFKRIKGDEAFASYADYLRYLYGLLKKYNKSEDFSDAGLTIACGIFRNDLISNEFKYYLKGKVALLVDKMRTNPEEADEANIFRGLRIYDCFRLINPERAAYVCEKFWDYLGNEAKKEIISERKVSFNDYQCFGNPEWARILINNDMAKLFRNDELGKAQTYEDLFELTLQAIYSFWRERDELK